MDEFIGIIKMFAGTYAPQGWMMCNGQLLKITDYQALYSLLGTTYGGDGKQTFALPDLQGRVVAGVGNGDGVHPVALGQKFGESEMALSMSNIPAHAHTGLGNITLYASSSSGSGLESDPTNNYLGPAEIYTSSFQAVAMQQVSANITTSYVGSGTSFTKNQPSLGINFIICVDGIYPQRP